MRTKALCIALALCLTAGLCACSAEDGKIKDNSEKDTAQVQLTPRSHSEAAKDPAARSTDSGSAADHHSRTKDEKSTADTEDEHLRSSTVMEERARDAVKEAKRKGEDLAKDAKNAVTGKELQSR